MKTTLLFIFCALACCFFQESAAQQLSDDPRFMEIWKKSQVLRDHQSIGAEIISFSIAGVNYKVPRNYINRMDHYEGGVQEMVIFKVTFPGFEPLTDKTKQCLTQPRAYWPAGCAPIEFWIDGQGKDMPIFTDDDHFHNSVRLFPNQTPKAGPAGFEAYQDGPDEAPRIIYRKKTASHTLIINCDYYILDGKRWADCSNYDSLLANGNGLSYRLDSDKIEQAEQIDDGIRSLLDSFTVKGTTP